MAVRGFFQEIHGAEAHRLHRRRNVGVARLGQIITNLCSNALMFKADGGVTLSIRTAQDGDDQRLEVAAQDTGVGISGIGRARLFERFSQAEGSLPSRFGGRDLAWRSPSSWRT